MRLSVIAAALVAAIVGFGGTIALVVSAAVAVGASPDQIASWVTAICLAMVAETAILSWRHKMPIITAWSTPGAALIAATTGFDIHQAVGAFILTAIALIITGLFSPLMRLVSMIPSSVSSGMLAGILAAFVIAAAKAAGTDPMLILPLAAAYFLLRLWNPALAVLGVLIGGMALAYTTGLSTAAPDFAVTVPVWIMPEFTLGAALGLALPLYLVTMASQNLAGLAVLRAADYHPPAGGLIAVTGFFSLLSAPFGGHSTNLAAISAAICTGPDAHPDHEKRWLTGPAYALTYLVLALGGGWFVAVLSGLPKSLIALVAGLALIAPFANAFSIALAKDAERIAAGATFAVTASAITFFGIGSAFWGLIAGVAVLALDGMKSAAFKR
ncbi:MAG: benzoate/H(+) symporter BenE family transporter [Rhizobiaceae bacterium]